MRESVLRDYFLELVDESRLSEDLAGSVAQTSYDVISYYSANDLTEDFEVVPTHLVKLCDAVLAGKINAKHLELIGFALIGSDCFIWNGDDTEGGGELVADVLHDWASPEINYPLTAENIAKFRVLLLTGKDTFTEEDVAKQTKKRKN
jgi:hypothetical protein